MKKSLFTREGFTPLTISLLAIAIVCEVLRVWFAWRGEDGSASEKIIALTGSIATIALALIAISSVKWTR